MNQSTLVLYVIALLLIGSLGACGGPDRVKPLGVQTDAQVDDDATRSAPSDAGDSVVLDTGSAEPASDAAAPAADGGAAVSDKHAAAGVSSDAGAAASGAPSAAGASSVAGGGASGAPSAAGSHVGGTGGAWAPAAAHGGMSGVGTGTTTSGGMGAAAGADGHVPGLVPNSVGTACINPASGCLACKQDSDCTPRAFTPVCDPKTLTCIKCPDPQQDASLTERLLLCFVLHPECEFGINCADAICRNTCE